MSSDRKISSKSVGDNIVAMRSNWSFAGDTADNFDAHIRRSVPFYEAGHELVCQLSDFFVRSGSNCYELGTSTGELLGKLVNYNSHKAKVRWTGVDSVEAMIDKARKSLVHFSNVELQVGDVADFDFRPSDFVVSYYCMQFVPPQQRQEIFNRIYESLNWGGAFVMFEKVRAPDARFQDIATALYDDFKRTQGYSDEEILSKSRSLRGVLEPYTSDANRQYLRRAGFQDITTVMKYVCFEGFLAIK